VAESVAAVVNAGGKVVQGVGGDPGELTARFLDPAGNLLALYQEPIQ
jgi:predicted enzyme related to lactoylglutathione lyase